MRYATEYRYLSISDIFRASRGARMFYALALHRERKVLPEGCRKGDLQFIAFASTNPLQVDPL